MNVRKGLLTLALVGFLGVTACGGQADSDLPPAAGGPDQTGQPLGQEMDPQMMALMIEAQQLQQELAPIQEAALQDEALAGQLEALQGRLESAMREENAELLDQMQELEQEFLAAQASGDEARAQEVGTEAQAVAMELQALQEAVMSRPDIRQSIEDFEEAQRARMLEVDPEAGEIMDRIDAIYAELETM